MWEDKKKGLKPCPFCGGEAVLRGSPYVGWIVFCERCAISSRSFSLKEKAIDRWNRRVNEQ